MILVQPGPIGVKAKRTKKALKEKAKTQLSEEFVIDSDNEVVEEVN